MAANSVVTQIQCSIYKNGTIYKYGNSGGASGWTTASCLVYANGTTDYFNLYGNLTGAAPFIYGSYNQVTSFSGVLVRSA